MKQIMRKTLAAMALAVALLPAGAQTTSWSADNGNGTFTNPLFYDEFSDPDIIRVGEDYYLAGTTMHSVPGLVILKSKDLVNWQFCSYCFDRFDESYVSQRNPMDNFSLQNGRDIYGQGIWAPVIRYSNGQFYVFTNVNGTGLQVYTSKDPQGPWTHLNTNMLTHDLSILFDEDGKIYIVYNYGNVTIAELKPDFSGKVDGTEKIVIPDGNAMGEGFHAYKIGGYYYLLSADYMPNGRLMVARSKNIYGPYETRVMGAEETLGTQVFPGVRGRLNPTPGNDDVVTPVPIDKNNNTSACTSMHQGGMVSTPDGQWWAVQLMDFVGVGRTVALSPVTWEDGWPYLGIEGNLTRSPRTWFKPNDKVTTPTAPYNRNEDFSGKAVNPFKSQRGLGIVWQWNHNPDEKMWSLKGGKLNLKTMPARHLMEARNSLTQRVIGPVSVATVTLDGAKLKAGDVAGLGIQNLPFAWIGLKKSDGGLAIEEFDQAKRVRVSHALRQNKVFLRMWADLDACLCTLSYSVDGEQFTQLGDTILMPYQLRTFQGSRWMLFAFNESGKNGGTALFDDFTVMEPLADRTHNLPLGKHITLKNLGDDSFAEANRHGMLHSTRNARSKDIVFEVVDCGQGKVALKTAYGYLCVVGHGYTSDIHYSKTITPDCHFLWQDMLRGQCMLMSLKTHRYVGVTPGTGNSYSAQFTGSDPNRKNGCVFSFEEVKP